MPSGEHDEGSAAAKPAAADNGTGMASPPAPPTRATPAPLSSPERAEERVRAALAAGTRTGASLSALFRAVEQMTDSLGGARDANRQLVNELEAMRQMLAARTEENESLEGQRAALRAERDQALRELEQVRSEAERERDFLVEEQDRFLAALLEDHEKALQALRRERDQARASADGPLTRPTTPETAAVAAGTAETAEKLLEAQRTIDKLMKERSISREMLRRLQTQRDEAQAALAAAGDDKPLNVTVRTETTGESVFGEPPTDDAGGGRPARSGRTTAPQGVRALGSRGRSEHATDPSPAAPPAQEAEASDPPRDGTAGPEEPFIAPAADAPRHRTTEPGLAAPTPSPEEPGGAIPSAATPAQDAPVAGDGKPALKRKPDPTAQSLGGYSLSADQVQVERVQSAQRGPQKPPQH